MEHDEDRLTWLAAQVDKDHRHAVSDHDRYEVRFKQSLLEFCRYHLDPDDEPTAYVASDILDMMVSLYESRQGMTDAQ